VAVEVLEVLVIQEFQQENQVEQVVKE